MRPHPESVREVEARFSRRAHRTMTLGGLVEHWERFATEVAEGYWGTIDDFTNDLTTRDVLEEAIGSLAQEPAGRLAEQLEPIDARYREVTTFDTEARLAEFFRLGDGWWWRRLPVVLGELQRDLQRP